ncbi:hypothetical protein D3C81_1006140 [compost metagenome]
MAWLCRELFLQHILHPRRLERVDLLHAQRPEQRIGCGTGQHDGERYVDIGGVHARRGDERHADDDTAAGNDLRQREQRRAVGTRQVGAADAQDHHRQRDQQVGGAPGTHCREYQVQDVVRVAAQVPGVQARDQGNHQNAQQRRLETWMQVGEGLGQRTIHRHAVEDARHPGHQGVDGGGAGKQKADTQPHGADIAHHLLGETRDGHGRVE